MKFYVGSSFSRIIVFSLACLTPMAPQAQLTDTTLTGPTVPGGSIAKSVEEQIGAGMGDVHLFGSSTYLIKRDPARSIRRGRQLFQRKFTQEQGLGPRVNFASEGDIASNVALGAGLSDSCASCHGRPRGAAGFGGDVVTRPDSRDAPHLFGLGLIEMLADEITKDLRSTRERSIERARKRGRRLNVRLTSKGISFGQLVVHPDGTVDTREVSGVDTDLRVRPFFHHGATISIREFIIGAFKDEMGLEAVDPVLCAATDPVTPLRVRSSAGMVFDPGLDAFNRPALCDALADGDDDGVLDELDPALIDHLEFYLLNYFKPATGKQTRTTQAGQRLMENIGCTSCHVQNLEIDSDRRVADVETRHDPQRGIFNRLYAEASTRFQVIEDGDAFPLLLPGGDSFVVRNIYADFKRHDLGPAFHERQHDGSIVTHFMTEPLWGVATTAPYGHDGRSIDLTEVILRHGGEATRSRRAFERLAEREQQAVLGFLRTLVLFPPDDTASNLNPGVPGGDPQTEHGSIALGVLFQIPEEGDE